MAATGRPTKYEADYAEQARKLCLLGATDAEMADFFGVAESTLNLWKLEHENFSESIKRGKMAADARVAESLLNRALGYQHPDTHVSSYMGEVILTELTKHYPPDTQAASLWLRNRQPSKWRDKQEVDLTTDIDQLSEEALSAEIERLIRATGAAGAPESETGED